MDATDHTTDTNQLLDEKSPGYVPGQVIVRYRPAGTFSGQSDLGRSSRLNTEAGAVNSTPLSPMGMGYVELVNLPAGADVQAAIAVYEKDPDVLYAEPNYLYRFVSVPNDPSFGLQWGLENTGQFGGSAGADISAPEAWNISTGSEDVIIAVSDTGVDYNHPDLGDNIWINAGENGTDAWGNDKRSNGIDDDLDGYIDDWNGWNFYFHNNDVMDYEGHGTHVSGIIGAVGNNSEGVSGVNWRVKIMPLDVSMRTTRGNLDDVSAIEGFNYAKAHGAKIISCSWGGGSYSSYMRDVITNNPDVLFIFAAGNDANDNDETPVYPASYPSDNIISVAASDTSDNLAGFSNYGIESVDLAAPGYQTYSTYPTGLGGYKNLSGTSMATPHVAGVAGLIMAMHPDYSAVQIKNAILQNVDIKSSFIGKVKSAGRLNAYTPLIYSDEPFSAGFTMNTTGGEIPLSVRFSDVSTGNPDTWRWDFGEGNVSYQQNPEFTFTRGGVFTVTLIVTNSTTGRTSVAYKTIVPFSTEPGVSWMKATGAAAFEPRYGHSAIVHDGRMWVIGGSPGGILFNIYLNDTWYSENGVNWTRTTGAAAFPQRYYHSSVTHNDRMWVIGGKNDDDWLNDVWYSEDGVNWSRATAAAPFSARYGHESVEFKNKIWVIGGISRWSPVTLENDVWYSGDGVNWTQATGSAPFGPRMTFGLVVFANKMWVIGGNNGNDWLNDVWYSDDGVNWTQATGAAAFSPRSQSTSVVYDNRMWVIAGLYDGLNEVGRLNDVWYSEDGADWIRATSSAEFPTRYSAASVVFNDRIWEIGGTGRRQVYTYNDVWYSPPYDIPTANFTATPRYGIRPLMVQFKDTSEDNPTGWHWDFGDNSTSDKQNPRHQYSIAGKYNVSLTAANLAGSNTTTKVRYITVTKPVPPATPTPPSYSFSQRGESDSSGKSVRTSLARAQNAPQGSVVMLTFDQNIMPEYMVAISRIQFVPDKDIVELEGIVQDISPGDILEVPGRRAAGYERIELVGINPRLVHDGSVLFQVAESWLTEEKVGPSDIVLMRYYNNTWVELPTRFDHQYGGSYYFIATTPGFSYFAVTVKPKRSSSAPVPESTSTLSMVSGTAPPAISLVGTPGSSPAPRTAVLQGIVTTVTTQPVPGPSQSRDPGIPLLVILGIPVVIGAAGGTYLVRRWWIRRQNPALFREYD